MTSTPLRLWTVEDYHRMIEAQILTSGDRVELVEGQILYMNPQQPPHAAATQRAMERFISQIVSGVIEYQHTLDEFIADFAPDWPLDQVAVIDR
ncbi:MAG: transcription antitermination factor NusB, partial [Cyanobacteriota bacterium]|nr:transcription antitermination factor NusB [Cyanobacteriota bacterium]